jgi:hypothetical protein
MEQWQAPTRFLAWVAVTWTAPQRQLPVFVVVSVMIAPSVVSVVIAPADCSRFDPDPDSAAAATDPGAGRNPVAIFP